MTFTRSLAAIAFALLFTAFALRSTPLGIMVPAYFAPSSGRDWNALDYAAARVPLIAIMNPDSGPGAGRDPAHAAYVQALANLHHAGGRAIGYVHTSYGARPLASVQTDIDSWLSFYAMDGFFIDEMTDDDNTNHLAYYAALYRYIKAKDARYRVTGNPGANTRPEYLTAPAADSLVIFENDQTNYPSFRPSPWVTRYPAQSFVHLVYGVTNAAAMSNDLQQAALRHVGWIYFTDRTYAALPSYWTNEVRWCQGYNRDAQR
jgi:hypothetical protein